MNNDDIIRALNHTNAPSELVEVIVAALTELDATLTESTANMIALQYVKEDYEQLRAENAALRAENNKLRFLNAVAEKAFDEGGATMDRASDEIERLLADNAALRARLDTCCEALMVDAEGR